MWIVTTRTCMNVFSWFLTSSGQLSKSLRSLVTLVLICLTSPVNASTVNLSNSDNHLHITEKIQYVWIAKLTLEKKYFDELFYVTVRVIFLGHELSFFVSYRNKHSLGGLGEIRRELIHKGQRVLVLFLRFPHQIVEKGDPRLVGAGVHQLIQGIDAEAHGVSSIAALVMNSLRAY